MRSAPLREIATRLWAQAAGKRGPPLADLVLILVDDAGSAAVNAAALAHEGPTDVITLRYDAIPGEPGGAAAEIIVNLERAVACSRPPDWSASHELALYIAHGCDHLIGHDDATAAARTAMRRRELAWLRQLPIPALFSGDAR